MPLYLPALPFRAQPGYAIVEGLIERHLREILTIVAGRDRAAEPQLAALRRVFAEQCAKQGRLPRSVAAENPQDAGPLQRATEARHQGPRADPDAHVPDGEHLVAAALGHLEPQRHGALGPDHRTESWQPLQPLAPALGLLAVLPGDVAGDVVLLVRNGALLLVERPLLRQPALGTLGHEIGVAGRVRRGAAAFQMQHVINGRGQKGAVVAHQQHGPLTRDEVLLEPAGRLEIEVVGRLVEQQHICGRHELAGKAEAAELAAAERGQGRDAGLRGFELEAVQHRVDARRDSVASLALETLEVFAVPGQRAGRGVMREIRGLLDQRLLQRQELGELAGRRFPNRGRGAVVAVLLEQRYAQSGRARDAPARRIELAGQQAEERRLAGAVPAHDAPALARSDRERDAREQRRVAEVHAHAAERDLAHGCALDRGTPVS